MSKRLEAAIFIAVIHELPQLFIDEGLRLEVYDDKIGRGTKPPGYEGMPTMGMGTLVTSSMPEWRYAPGTPITAERAWFEMTNEMSQVMRDAEAVFGLDYIRFPSEVQRVIINMLYQFGRGRFLDFKNTIRAAHTHDWKTMAREMRDSDWWRSQYTRDRAERLAKRVEALAPAPVGQHA